MNTDATQFKLYRKASRPLPPLPLEIRKSRNPDRLEPGIGNGDRSSGRNLPRPPLTNSTNVLSIQILSPVYSPASSSMSLSPEPQAARRDTVIDSILDTYGLPSSKSVKANDFIGKSPSSGASQRLTAGEGHARRRRHSKPPPLSPSLVQRAFLAKHANSARTPSLPLSRPSPLEGDLSGPARPGFLSLAQPPSFIEVVSPLKSSFAFAEYPSGSSSATGRPTSTLPQTRVSTEDHVLAPACQDFAPQQDPNSASNDVVMEEISKIQSLLMVPSNLPEGVTKAQQVKKLRRPRRFLKRLLTPQQGQMPRSNSGTQETCTPRTPVIAPWNRPGFYDHSPVSAGMPSVALPSATTPVDSPMRSASIVRGRQSPFPITSRLPPPPTGLPPLPPLQPLRAMTPLTPMFPHTPFKSHNPRNFKNAHPQRSPRIRSPHPLRSPVRPISPGRKRKSRAPSRGRIRSPRHPLPPHSPSSSPSSYSISPHSPSRLEIPSPHYPDSPLSPYPTSLLSSYSPTHQGATSPSALVHSPLSPGSPVKTQPLRQSAGHVKSPEATRPQSRPSQDWPASPRHAALKTRGSRVGVVFPVGNKHGYTYF